MKTPGIAGRFALCVMSSSNLNSTSSEFYDPRIGADRASNLAVACER
jgi:hypothetical protein